MPTPLVKVREVGETLADALVGGGVVVLLPPLPPLLQPAKTINPTRTTKKLLKVAMERFLVLIAPPPA